MGVLLDALTELQGEVGWLRPEDLAGLAERLNVPLYRLEGLVSFYPHFRRTPPPAVEVLLCRDISCRLAGGAGWCAGAREALSARTDVEVREVSCLGRCELAPAAAVNEHPLRAIGLAADGAKRFEPLVARVASPPAHGELPQPTATPRTWASDPYAGRQTEHYSVVRRLLDGATAQGLRDPDALVQALEDSGLRGMGGAGFPTGVKWQMVRKERAQPKYIVCNADESEPGTFKDRVILEELPHLVLEGMILAGLTVGAEEGIVFIRHEYGAERVALLRAIDDAHRRGALGGNACGSGLRFDVRVAVSPGGYILGEETALLECLEDKRGEPRNKPPFPGQKGLWDKPTLMNNVETFSYVPLIAAEGADAWRARGLRGCTGLKFIALSGDVLRPGVYLVPMGTTVGELLEQAGGVVDQKRILAIAPGGASSNFLRGDAVDAPLDFKALADRGSMLGSGAVLVVAEGADIVDLGTNVVAFFRNESCGKCVPCRVGSAKAVEMLEAAVAGRGSKKHLAMLPELHDTLAQTSICGLGQVAIAPFLSILRAFDDEVRSRFPLE
jgi:NADH:ubiquinone oxidoreductase subunit F (NADH-binding)